MEIIAVCSQKGGSGKTTTAINLSGALSINGKRVFLIDLDPQAHATMGLNIESNFSIYDVLSKVSRNKQKLHDIIVAVEKNFSIAPSSLILSTIDQELSDEIGREARLRDVINNEFDKNKYDYIIIDCPPNLGLLTINALRIASSAIIPVEPSRFSFEGVTQVVKIIHLVYERLNHHLAYKILVSNFDSRLQHSFQMLDRIKETFMEKVYSTIIHINVKLKESQAAGKTVFSYDKYSRGSKDFFSFAREIISEQQQKEDTTTQKISEKLRNTTFKKIEEFQRVTFSFNAPTARSVFIVGDFNGWNVNGNAKLEKANGVWSKEFPLDSGTYQYRFVVDGQWLEDPTNQKTIKNPFGEHNSLLEIT